MNDLLAASAPSYDEICDLRRGAPWVRRRSSGLTYPPVGRFDLIERISEGPEDACHYALLNNSRAGIGEWGQPLFLRTFDRAVIDDHLVEELKRRALVSERGIEQIFELGADGATAFVVSELVEGASLAQLRAALDARQRLLSWPVTLALLCDAAVRLQGLHTHDIGAGSALTASRVRLSIRGMIYLCHGGPVDLPHGAPPDPPTDLLRHVLPLALPPNDRGELENLLTGPDPRGVAVAADRLLERRPDLDPELLLPVLRAHLPDLELPGPRPTREEARALVARHLDPAAAREVWDLVLACSPDLHGGYEPLGRPA